MAATDRDGAVQEILAALRNAMTLGISASSLRALVEGYLIATGGR